MSEITLVIHSNPQSHKAALKRSGITTEIGPFPTEIDLVQALSTHGVDLKKMECLWSRGHGFNCISFWRS